MNWLRVSELVLGETTSYHKTLFRILPSMIYFDSGWKLLQIKKHLKFHINNQYKLTTTNITRRPSKAKKLSKLHTTKPQPTKIRITTKLYLLQNKQFLLTWCAKDFLPSLKFIKRHEKETSFVERHNFHKPPPYYPSKLQSFIVSRSPPDPPPEREATRGTRKNGTHNQREKLTRPSHVPKQ